MQTINSLHDPLCPLNTCPTMGADCCSRTRFRRGEWVYNPFDLVVPPAHGAPNRKTSVLLLTCGSADLDHEQP